MAAQKIADIAAFDITSPFKEYSDDLRSSLSELQKFVRENPDSLVYSRNPDKYLEREEKINAFLNKRKIATVNDTLYNAAKAEVELMANGPLKDIAKQKLDLRAKNLFSDGLDVAYNRQFEASTPPKPQDSIIPTVPVTMRETFIKLPNDNVTIGITYGDLDDVRAKSRLIAAGGQRKDITNTDWFKNLPEGEKELALKEAELPLTELKEIESTAASVNSLLAQWQAANPNIDIDTVDLNTLPNDSFGNAIRSARAINSQIDELNSFVLQGRIPDPTGKVRTIPYEKFNLKDGLSSDELISMQSIQKSKTPLIQKVDKTVQNTDDSFERQRISLGWANVNNDAGVGLKDAIENPAIQFGGHINRVKTYFKNNPKANGMIVSFDALDEDTKKALGLYKQNEEGKLVPIEMEGRYSFVTYFNDGTYRVGTNKGGDGGNPGTLETLRQGYVNSVKAGLNKEGVQTEGFQKNAEDGFRKIFGVNNSEAIWDSWSGGGDKKQESSGDYYNSQDNVQSQSGNRITYKDGTVWEIKGNKLNKVK